MASTTHTTRRMPYHTHTHTHLTTHTTHHTLHSTHYVLHTTQHSTHVRQHTTGTWACADTPRLTVQGMVFHIAEFSDQFLLGTLFCTPPERPQQALFLSPDREMLVRCKGLSTTEVTPSKRSSTRSFKITLIGTKAWKVLFGRAPAQT